MVDGGWQVVGDCWLMADYSLSITANIAHPTFLVNTAGIKGDMIHNVHSAQVDTPLPDQSQQRVLKVHTRDTTKTKTAYPRDSSAVEQYISTVIPQQYLRCGLKSGLLVRQYGQLESTVTNLSP